MLNHRINVMHGIANRTFFLHGAARGAVLFALTFCGNTSNNFMLVGINYALPCYKTDPQYPREKNIYPALFQNKLMLFLFSGKIKHKNIKSMTKSNIVANAIAF